MGKQIIKHKFYSCNVSSFKFCQKQNELHTNKSKNGQEVKIKSFSSGRVIFFDNVTRPDENDFVLIFCQFLDFEFVFHYLTAHILCKSVLSMDTMCNVRKSTG